MSEVLKKMETRRSIRKYKKMRFHRKFWIRFWRLVCMQPVDGGQQNTIMIQVTDPKMRDEIAAKNCEIGGWEEGFDPFYGAPAMIICAG